MGTPGNENTATKVVAVVAILLGVAVLNELFPELTGTLFLLLVSLALWLVVSTTLARWNRYIAGLALLVTGGVLLFLGLGQVLLGFVGVLYVLHGGWLAMTGAAGLEL